MPQFYYGRLCQANPNRERDSCISYLSTVISKAGRQGADPNFTHHAKPLSKDPSTTILMQACEKTSLAFVEILFAAKEEIILKDAKGNYLSHYACRNRDEN
jgi:ankyrin repeat protein